MKTIRPVGAAWLIGLCLAWGSALALGAESVTDQLKSTVDQVVEILREPRARGDSSDRDRQERLRQAISPRFDFEEMAKRSLGEYWQRYASRKKEFVDAFTHFVEDSYLSRLDAYQKEKILYGRERVDEGYAEVDTKIVTAQGDEVPIDYKLHAVGSDWKIYDVLIDNVSLVNNYRAQFKRILYYASFDELLKRLQAKSPEKKDI